MPRLAFARLAFALFVAFLACAPAARAQPLAEEWSHVAIPPMPDLKAASVDAATTALFMISMTQETCNAATRPRCHATVGPIARLLSQAREHRMLVVHSLTRGGGARDNLVRELAPREGEPVLPAGPGPDKFIGSNLDEILKSHGVTTVIIVGTQAQTAVLHTGAGSAFRGYKVVVPIDGMSSDTAFPELYTSWHLATASRIGEFVTLTSIDKIQIGGTGR